MKLFIQESAEQDILDQIEWYAERGLSDIARRFSVASVQAINALLWHPTLDDYDIQSTLGLRVYELGR